MRDIRKQLLCCCNTRFCKAVGNGSGAMMQITEDTPPDMLAGAMDLTVHLPNSQSPVKMAVNRSTPMMDLLIHVTTLHRLQPSSYIIEALAYAPNLHMSDQVLPYRPNTPIGALDTQHIRIIPKSPPAKSTGNKSITSTSNRVSSHQPFESTFRLQVHLPRNQLYVVRVSQHVMLENIMQKVCTEKNLDQRKYEFRHPDNLQERLDPKLSLADYQLTEVNVVQKGKSVTISDMAALQREEERRKQQTRNGGGVFNLIFKKRKSGTRSGSISSDTRSISPSRSDESNSRSITPPAIPMPQLLEKVNRSTLHDVNNVPKPPQRKRRPAPKPPIQSETPKIEETYEPLSTQPTVTVNLQIGNTDTITDQVARDNNGQTIYHSRNSSDSSGYHEASILSDTINMHTLPRRNKNCRSSTSSINQIVTSPANECTQSTSNLTSMENHSKSTSVINFSGTKKKRAPPPPTIKMSASASNLSTPVVASVKSVDSIPMPDIPVPIPRKASASEEPDNFKAVKMEVPKPKPRNMLPITSIAKSKEKLEYRKTAPQTNNATNICSESQLESNQTVRRLSLETSNFVTTKPEFNESNWNLEQSESTILNPEFNSFAQKQNNSSNTSISNTSLEQLSVTNTPDLIINLAKLSPIVPTFKELDTGLYSPDLSRNFDNAILERNLDEFNAPELICNIPEKSENRELNSKIKSDHVLTINTAQNIDNCVENNTESCTENSRDEVIRDLPNNALSNKTKPRTEEIHLIVGQNTVILKTATESKISSDDEEEVVHDIKRFNMNNFEDPPVVSKLNSSKQVSTMARSNEKLNPLHTEDNTKIVSNKNIPFRSISRSDDEFDIQDFDIFEKNATPMKKGKKFSQEFGRISDAEIFELEKSAIQKLPTGSKLCREFSFDMSDSETLPTFMNSTNMKKWNDFDSLDGISLISEDTSSIAWVAGDCCETDTMSNSSSTQILTEQNTETSSKLTLASPDSLTVNAEEINPATVSLIIDECKTRDLCANIKEERVITPSTVQPLTTFAVEEIDLPRRPTESPINIYPHADVKSEISTEHIDADWQYQLPAPPTEFRDFHPNSLTMTDNYETISIHGLGNDSSNTLQEQVSINSTTPIDWRSETATIVESDIVLPTPLVPSVPQDFSDGSANILSGYHSLDILEKRQSQFLEKQLAGINFNENHDNESNTHLTTKYNINREFKEGIENYKNTENNQSEKQARFENKYGTLPNFKITTYSEPKKVVNIFENVDICSQAETKLRSSKRCSLDESKYVNDSKLFSGVSERNMNVLNTIQSETPFKKPVVVEIKSKVDTVAQHPAISNMSLHKANAFAVSTDNLTGKFSNIHRSDSLRINDLTSPDFNPVKRSKSHISLMKNKPMTSSEINYENNKRNHSNPLNVSECLQSLQVMRTILPKISNSPPSHSPEENIQTISKPEEIKEPEHPVEVAKVYRYSPPSINLGTWSERPKSQVSLKQDRDYKIGGAAVVREKTMNLSQKSVPLNSVASDNIDSKLLRLDATSQMDQVSVKNSVPNELGNQNTIPTGAIACDIKQLINHTTPTGFKRSHLSADKTVRPHSISFDTYQDLSRVPIVRSVELKKSYRNFQNSGSQSISDTQPTKNYNSDLKIQNRSRDATDSFRRGESVDNNRQNDNYSNKNSVSHRLNSFEEFKGYNINRGNSFLANRTSMPMPVVKGFRSVIPPKPNQNTKTNDIKPSFLRTTNGTNGCDIDKQNRETRPETNLNSQARNSENKYASVAVNSDKNAMDNNQTMVSRNGSHNLNSIKNNVPAPPIMPKVNSITSKKFPAAEIQPRDQLLEAIRNFGKNSLKHVRH